MRNIFKVIAIILLLVIIRNLLVSIQEQSNSNGTVSTLQQDLEKKKYENAFLKQKLSFVQSNDFIEEQARDKLGMAKPGEYIVIGPDAEKKQEEKQIAKDQTPNLQKWWKLFF